MPALSLLSSLLSERAGRCLAGEGSPNQQVPRVPTPCYPPTGLPCALCAERGEPCPPGGRRIESRAAKGCALREDHCVRRCLLFMLLSAWGCAPPTPIPGVIRPGPGEPMLEKLPGPMPGFGPFDAYSDALIAACPLILSKPNATAGRLGSQDLSLRWRASQSTK